MNVMGYTQRLLISTLFGILFVSPCLAAESIYHTGWIDFNKNGKKDIYEDPCTAIEKRVNNLLSQMTVDEKTMQLVTLYGYQKVLQDKLPTPEWKNKIWKDGIGNIDEHVNGYRSEGSDWPPSEHTKLINEVQKWFIEETRLGIPADFTNEGIRGIAHTKATNFPSQLGVGASWDRQLVRSIGQITGEEGFALGYTNVYSPIIDVPRDPRWGRMVECYSENPFLIAELGIEQARGLKESGIGVTCKHFAVYGIPNGGRDGHARTDPQVTPREMEMFHLYTFERVIKEVGIHGVMSSYNDWDGEPISGSSYFLIDILRKRMGFNGYVVSDSEAVEFLSSKHCVEPDYKNAVRCFIESGGNVRTFFDEPNVFVMPLRENIADGSLSMKIVDSRVSDVLRVKFMLGLFDKPYRNGEEADKIVACKEHKDKALEAARECIVLLKNENSILPLNAKNIKRILVTGPNADEKEAHRCRYGPSNGPVISILEGIREITKDSSEIIYKQGCPHYSKVWPKDEIIFTPLSDEELQGINQAVAAAKDCDLIIAAVGENKRMVGEGYSRTSLDLPPIQNELLYKLHETGKPIIVVLASGRAESINWVQQNCPAVIESWFGGEFTGQAVAEVLFGKYNAGGKLPITFPRSVGQIPLAFPCKPGAQNSQKNADSNGIDKSCVVGPLYPFGYGLSYTKFKYSDLIITPNKTTANTTISVSLNITNTGKMAGTEIVQLYVRDKVSSVTTYEKDLRGFERVYLEPGQTKNVVFTLEPTKHFWLIDRNLDRVVEPGDFEIMLGSSSNDIRLRDNLTITGKNFKCGDSFLSCYGTK
jgi:beta-glucosidase